MTQARMGWVWVFVAALLLLIANGANTVASAAWLAPVFLLRFVRVQRARVGLPVAFLVLAVTYAFQFRGMIPLPLGVYLLYVAFFGLLLVIPYVLDKWVALRLERAWLGTLVFPLAWVMVEYLSSFSISGTLGASVAYSQYGQLPLLQLLSVTGLWGITFLIGWFASTVNAVWERGFTAQSLRLGGIMALVFVLVVMGGGMRMTLFPPTSDAVRIAGITRAPIGVDERDVTSHLRDRTATPEQLEDFRRFAVDNNNDLLSRAERAARAGAEIIVWGEANSLVLSEDEPAFIEQAAAVARNEEVYLAIGMVSWDSRTEDRPATNKVVMITPEGSVAWEYLKSQPIPGPEMAQLVPGDGVLRSIDTPYGKLTAVICFDADFQRLLMQAGELDADLLINPSSDWPAITPLHAQVASFRSIEQGINQIRSASDGASTAYDHQGRVLAFNSYFQAGNRDLVAYVPTEGSRTLYSMLGDWFAWLSLVLLTVLVGGAVRRPTTATVSPAGSVGVASPS